MYRKFSKGLGLIITVGGIISTSLLIRDASKKERLIIEKCKQENKSVKKELVKLYIPSILAGAVTVTSVVTSHVLNKKTEASLLALGIMSDKAFKKYRGYIKDVVGVETGIYKYMDKLVSEKEPVTTTPDNDLELYYDEYVGYFWANSKKLLMAYSNLNQRMILGDKTGVSISLLWDFISDAGAIVDDIQEDSLIKRGCYGWSKEYLSNTTSHNWIHMTLRKVKEHGDYVTQIIWDRDPILIDQSEYINPNNITCVELDEGIQYTPLIINHTKEENK